MTSRETDGAVCADPVRQLPATLFERQAVAITEAEIESEADGTALLVRDGEVVAASSLDAVMNATTSTASAEVRHAAVLALETGGSTSNTADAWSRVPSTTSERQDATK